MRRFLRTGAARGVETVTLARLFPRRRPGVPRADGVARALRTTARAARRDARARQSIHAAAGERDPAPRVARRVTERPDHVSDVAPLRRVREARARRALELHR